jgi:hypothetical protein
VAPHRALVSIFSRSVSSHLGQLPNSTKTIGTGCLHVRHTPIKQDIFGFSIKSSTPLVRSPAPHHRSASGAVLAAERRMLMARAAIIGRRKITTSCICHWSICIFGLSRCVSRTALVSFTACRNALSTPKMTQRRKMIAITLSSLGMRRAFTDAISAIPPTIIPVVHVEGDSRSFLL